MKQLSPLSFVALFILFLSSIDHVESWSLTNLRSSSSSRSIRSLSKYHRLTTNINAAAVAISGGEGAEVEEILDEKERLRRKARAEGGRFTIHTKLGSLNPYGFWYMFMSVFLGLFWYASMWFLQGLYFLSRNRLDPRRRLVTLASQCWGESMMWIANIRPPMEGLDKFQDYMKNNKNQTAMLVANHNSWLDIPFLGTIFGWKYNYKLVSKAELGKVPILGKAIRLGRHVMLDRNSRKSQILTIRQGMDLLKNGVYVCTFPEGTRSKTGRLAPFKNGAFKMAHKVKAPVIPVSIVGSGSAMPHYWLMPFQAPSKVAKVIIHDPISSEDKTEAELVRQVRAKIIEGLPEDQRPTEEEENEENKENKK